MALDVLADDWLLVRAGDVVPLDAVAIEVVEDSHTGLGLAALALLAVVRLADARTKEKKTRFNKINKSFFPTRFFAKHLFSISNFFVLWCKISSKRTGCCNIKCGIQKRGRENEKNFFDCRG